MDSTLRIETPAIVRASIARLMLGSRSHEPPLGSINLHEHQSSVIERLMNSLHERGGALLCDEVGMGKTFVALAIARRHESCLIVAPAALRNMWRDALASAGMTAGFASYEQLSRRELGVSRTALLVLDEAHHARNPATGRYHRIAILARDARVLMLTATPVHNRRADLTALLSLFLGSRAKNLSESEIAACVVRRDAGVEKVTGIPAVAPVSDCDVPDDAELVAQLMAIPPPLPARDGASGGSLINRGLVHQWASSEGALKVALRRRLGKAVGLVASLEAGRYPSAAELTAWAVADDAVQLGFPELLAPPTADASTLLETVRSHAAGLKAILEQLRHALPIDDVRSRHLLRIRRESAGCKIVAFAQYSSTIAALYRRLANFGRVAMLTADGAQVAGGNLSRREVIERFAPRANGVSPPSEAEGIDLLLATDLLSEGVNLQDAGIVVHLDVPWTAARLDQRVGRVARMGSVHSQVRVFQIKPPASAERVLRAQILVGTKWDTARALVGTNGVPPLSSTVANDSTAVSIPARVEELRSILHRWNRPDSDPADAGAVLAAAVSGNDRGFIAAGYRDGQPALVVSRAGRIAADLDAQISACRLAEGEPTAAHSADYTEALRMIQEWSDQEEASASAGLAISSPTGRKKVLRRIDAALQSAPPHLRVSRARTAAVARDVASASHGSAIEQELEGFAGASMPDDDWLEAVAALAPVKGSERVTTAFQVRALLLFGPDLAVAMEPAELDLRSLGDERVPHRGE